MVTGERGAQGGKSGAWVHRLSLKKCSSCLPWARPWLASEGLGSDLGEAVPSLWEGPCPACHLTRSSTGCENPSLWSWVLGSQEWVMSGEWGAWQTGGTAYSPQGLSGLCYLMLTDRETLEVVVKRTGSELSHQGSDPGFTPTPVTLGKPFNLLVPQFPPL